MSKIRFAGKNVARVFCQIAREEENGLSDLVDDISLPIPCWRVDREGAEHDFAVDLELGIPSGKCFGYISGDSFIGDRSGVNRYEELEIQSLGLRVELRKPTLGQRPVRPLEIDSKSVDTSCFCEIDVVGVVIVWGLEDQHVVRKDHRSGGALASFDGLDIVGPWQTDGEDSKETKDNTA